MSITKIKFDGNKTEIHYTREIDGGNVTKETVYKCAAERHADFTKAVQDIVPLAISLLCLPMAYVDGVTVRGLSISENDHQGLGLVVTLIKDLPGINSPFVMNTPHVHNAEDSASQMPTVLRIQLEVAIREAEAFLNGKRAQEDMFEGKAA